MSPDASFWRGKRVLVTGQTGFKGAWLAFWLTRLGADVTGIALAPEGTPNLFSLLDLPARMTSHVGDIRDARATENTIVAARPDLVLHLAAQALVRPGYADPVGTFATNVQGTVNVLEAVRRSGSARAVVAVTTDKVYRNREWCYPYREDDALGGHDPYSASKAAAEIAIACYRDAFFAGKGIRISAARAGNVIGGGDWSRDRLIPDAVRAWSVGETLSVRRPAATRPWQHVLDPLAAYLVLAEHLYGDAPVSSAYNFGPEPDGAATVRTVIGIARDGFGRGDVSFGDGSEGPHEAGVLALEIARARAELDIEPRWNLDAAVRTTMAWYRDLADGASADALCDRDISAFEVAR